jgi:hypothetical protein
MAFEPGALRQQVAIARASETFEQHEPGHRRGGAAAEAALHGDLALDADVERRIVDPLALRQRVHAARDVVVPLERDARERAAQLVARSVEHASHGHTHIQADSNRERVEAGAEIGRRAGHLDPQTLDSPARFLDWE